MYLFNHTYPTPEQNIAIDEQLLKKVNQGHYTDGILRLWESDTYFVVLGLSKKTIDDVHETTCINDNIPILKRCSGGGTVLQGPGCFNYGYILPISYDSRLASINDTTDYILNTVRQQLLPYIPNVELKGISDLVINQIKFSGNAQRRLKHAILFHGTILYNFDLKKITRYLKEPPIQPEYRKKRSHQDFVNNISINQTDLYKAFTNHQQFSSILSSDLIS